MMAYLTRDEFGMPLFKAIQLSASRRILKDLIRGGKHPDRHEGMTATIIKIEKDLDTLWDQCDPTDVRRILADLH